MGPWDWLHPAEGNSINLGSSIGHLSILKGMIQTTENTALEGFNAVLDDVWIGKGRATWRNSTRVTVDALPDVKAAYESAQTAVTNYKSTFDAIKISYENEHQKLVAAEAILYSTTLYLPPDPRALVDVIARADAVRDRDEARRAIAALAGQRQAADDAFVSAMTRALPASWEQTRAMYAAIGITSLSDLTSSTIGTALAELARQIAASNSPGDASRLNDLMAIYGTDPEVMDAFFQELGGVETLSLIDELGDSYGNSLGGAVWALELAQRIRLGLSIASSDWSQHEAQAFNESMWYGTPANDDEGWFEYSRLPAMAYLFGDEDGAPMGEQLTIAAVNTADQEERINGNVLIVPLNLNNDGGAALFAAENPDVAQLNYTPGGQEYYAIGMDLAGNIFQTLGTNYHEAALDFLAPNASNPENDIVGDQRIEHWFGDHDWTIDGFEGPGDLWMGAQQADGGPFSPVYDPSTGPRDPNVSYRDPAVMEQMAWLASRAMWELDANPSFLTENVSNLGAAALAGAFAPHLDSIAGLMLRGGDDPGSEGIDLATEFGTGQQWAAPVLTDDMFARFLAAVGSHESGATVIAGTIDLYQQVYILQGLNDPSLLGEAISRSTWLQGMLDGSGIGGLVGEAERYDEAVDEAASNVMKVVGLIPIPGASKLIIEGGSFVLDSIQKLAVAYGKEAAVDLLTGAMHQTDDVVANMTDRAAAQAVQVRLDLANLIASALGPEVIGDIPSADDFATADEFGEHVNDWWLAKAAELRAADIIPGYEIDMVFSRYTAARTSAEAWATGATVT